jgi:putative Ca2+/H+ antiporter (TMEM165/GDT1 family)
MAGRREDLVSSFRLAGTEEARLFGGGVLALVVYALWVGLSGAALTFGADALEVGLSPEPWTGTKTGLAAVALVAWVVVPAALAAWLLVRQLTNESGNIAQRYRYRYPGVLLAPPAVLLLVALAATVALDGPPWPVFLVLVFAALFLLVRTVAYGYRVFSLSSPRALAAAAGLSFLALAVALLTGGAAVAQRRDYLVAVTEGFTGAVGVDAAAWVVTGSVTVAGATLPAPVAAAVAVPVGLSVLYLLVQTLAGVVNRIREPDVPRSELRTGQRYPDFARPTTSRTGGVSGSGSGGSTPPTSSPPSAGSAGSASGSSPGSASAAGDGTGAGAGSASSASPSSPPDPSPDSTDRAGAESSRAAEGSDDSPTVDTGPADPQVTDDVSNTRVYTPPGEGDGDDEDPLSFGADPGDDRGGAGTGDSAAGAGDTGAGPSDATEDDVCPECGESHDPGAVFCSACGAALE